MSPTGLLLLLLLLSEHLHSALSFKKISYALYFRKLESLGYIFAADSMGLSSFV